MAWYDDKRYTAGRYESWGIQHDIDHKIITLTLENDNSEEEILIIPAEFTVCDICLGEGKYVNPNIDSHGIGVNEFDEDPGFTSQYLRGQYDIICQQCKGLRVVLTPASYADKQLRQRYYNHIIDMTQEDASDRRAMAMGY